jgi:uroporphyrinogen decarboxylase
MAGTMTPRERVAKVLRFEAPDRVPLCLGGATAATISAFAYQDLRRWLGLEEKPARVHDLMQVVCLPHEDVYARYGLDIVPLSLPVYLNRWKRWSPREGYAFDVFETADLRPRGDGGWLLRQPGGTKCVTMPAGGWFFDDLEGAGWYAYDTGLRGDAYWRAMEEAARHLYEATDYAIRADGTGGYFSTDPAFLMRMKTDPAALYDELARRVEDDIGHLECLVQAVGKYVFAIGTSDDMGAQNAEMASPADLRALIFPHYRRLIGWLHAHSGAKFWLHSCGSIARILPDLVEMGVDILNPVQTSAAGMAPEGLAARFGGKIVFCGGGCDTQRVLPFAAPDEVDRHVRERVRLFAPTKGFIFAAVHNVVAGVPPANVDAMLRAARDEGGRVFP